MVGGWWVGGGLTEDEGGGGGGRGVEGAGPGHVRVHHGTQTLHHVLGGPPAACYATLAPSFSTATST